MASSYTGVEDYHGHCFTLGFWRVGANESCDIEKSGQCRVLNVVVLRGTCVYQRYQECRHAKPGLFTYVKNGKSLYSNLYRGNMKWVSG